MRAYGLGAGDRISQTRGVSGPGTAVAARKVDMRIVVDDDGRAAYATGTHQFVQAGPDQDGDQGSRAVVVAAANEGKRALFQMYDSGCAGHLFTRFCISADPAAVVLRIFGSWDPFIFFHRLEHGIGTHTNTKDTIRASSTEERERIQGQDLSHIISDGADPARVLGLDRGGPCRELGPAPRGRAFPRCLLYLLLQDTHNDPGTKRPAVISALAEPGSLKVDLEAPEAVVFLSAVKSMTGLSILWGQDDRERQRLNLQRLQ
ncbi:hypothetical protein BC828DRAFT_383498 [Blastocladiella britannica]|nr:hypothetical protein BC828DRAFT_383498 [Blastocladiella britannica]